MKLPLPKYAYSLILLCLLFSGCQSSKPAYLFSENSRNYISKTLSPTAEKNLAALISTSEKEPKTIAISKGKVLYAANTTQPTEISASSNSSQENYFPANIQIPEKSEKIIPVKTDDEPEKVRGHKLSGIFLAAGTILLLVALGLVIAGTSGAGIVAWIGGGFFLTGFIFSLVALLGR